ncbi:hypothetical protein ACLB2K_029092 [Fragaria x ananassa]
MADTVKTQYRASLHPWYVTMEEYLNVLHDHTKTRLMNHSPFWNFMKIFYHGGMKKKDCKKVDEDIRRMINAYNVEQKGFMFGERLRIISVDDVSNIFGVPKEGVMLNAAAHITKPEGNFIINTYFKGDKVTKVMIDDALRVAIHDKKQQKPRDVVCLLTMSIFATFFFCGSGSTLSWKLVETCTDDMTLKNYNWAQIILDYLHQGLSKKKEDKDVALSGCLPLMMYWLGDKTYVGGLNSMNQFYTPTFARWSLPEMHKALVELTNDQLEDMIEAREVDRKPNVVELQSLEDAEIHMEELETPSFGEWVIFTGCRFSY